MPKPHYPLVPTCSLLTEIKLKLYLDAIFHYASVLIKKSVILSH